jgi:phage shock protein PspC (stress-responsive transcriptional regulator)
VNPTEPAPAAASDPLRHVQRRARRPLGADAPLFRSRRRVIGGVCAGIATFVGARANVVRSIWLISLLPSLGITALAYPAMWLLLPLEPAGAGDTQPAAEAHAGDRR